MKLYMHKMTLEYRAYGELLDRESGLAWTTDGTPATRCGFERGDFAVLEADKRCKVSGAPPSIELVIGKPFTIISDCDPHGLS